MNALPGPFFVPTPRRWSAPGSLGGSGDLESPCSGALVDPDRPTVAWFGSRHSELPTVQDLQDAIGDYAVLGSEVRAALEADRIGRVDQAASPAAVGPLRLVAAAPSSSVEDQPSVDPSIGRALVALALMVGVLVVVLLLALIGVIAGAANP
jgi:hypothetical protein